MTPSERRRGERLGGKPTLPFSKVQQSPWETSCQRWLSEEFCVSQVQGATCQRHVLSTNEEMDFIALITGTLGVTGIWRSAWHTHMRAQAHTHARTGTRLFTFIGY